MRPSHSSHPLRHGPPVAFRLLRCHNEVQVRVNAGASHQLRIEVNLARQPVHPYGLTRMEASEEPQSEQWAATATPKDRDK